MGASSRLSAAGWLFLASFVLGVVVIGAIAIVARLVTDDGSVPIVFAEEGDCFVFPDASDTTSIESITIIDCATSHDAEVVAAGELNPDGDLPYPDDEELFALTAAACGDPQRFEALGFGLLPVSPNELTWKQGQGSYVCVALTHDHRMVDGHRTAPVDGI